MISFDEDQNILGNLCSNGPLKPYFFYGNLSDLVDVQDFDIRASAAGLDWQLGLTGQCARQVLVLPVQDSLAIQEAENSRIQSLELVTLLPCHWGVRGAERFSSRLIPSTG